MMEGGVTGQQTVWEDLSDTQLKDALVRRGLNTDGGRPEIIQRLQEYDSLKGKIKEPVTDTAEDLLKTEETDNDVVMMTDKEMQEIIDQPEVDLTQDTEESGEMETSQDYVVVLDEVVEDKSDATTQEKNDSSAAAVNGDSEMKSSEEAKEEEAAKDEEAEKEGESQEKGDEKDKPILMKNRMFYGYLCSNAVKSVLVTPFKKEVMTDEVFVTWLEEASSYNIRKTWDGASGVLLKFPTLDKGDSACCALKAKLASYEVEVYHPNKDIFSSSRNSWTNLFKDVRNPQETLFNRLLIMENIPETHNTDEKLCELFPGAIDVISFQFDPGSSGIAVVEFFDIKAASEFMKKTEGQIEIEGEKLRIYRYDKRHQHYAKLQGKREEETEEEEIDPLSDEERKQMTDEYKAIKIELDNLQNSDSYFAVEKVARFVEIDNKVNDMVKILTSDTTRRFTDGDKEMPEGEENMLTCVRNTMSKMQNKIDTAKAKGTYNPGHEGGGGGNRSERGKGRGRGGGKGNRHYSREDSPSFKSRFSQGEGGWRTMARDRGGRGGRRERSPGYRQGRSGYHRRDSSPGYRRNRSPDYRRDRSPIYKRDYSRGWSPEGRRDRSPGYRREMSPYYGRGWSPDYRGSDYGRARSPMYSKLEDKDFRNKAEGPTPTSKVLQEFTAVLADKVRSLEQLQQQTLQAQIFPGSQIMGGGMSNPSMGSMGGSQGYGGSSQGSMYSTGYGGRM